MSLFLETKPYYLKITFTISLLIFAVLSTNAQYTNLGAGAYGRANSLVAVPDISSVYQNPAGIACLNDNFVAVAIHKTLPVEGLTTVGSFGQLSTKVVNFGFSVDNFGDQYYHETRLGIAAAKKMDKVSMGLKFSLMNNAVKEMSSRQTFLGEFGILAIPSKFFSIGLHVVNFTRAKLYDSQALPTFINFGIGLNPSKKINISGQVDYPVGEKPFLKMGLNYQIKESLGLSAGINPNLNSVHLGLNLDIKKYKFSYAVSTHPNVGLSNHLTLALLLNGKK
ncbi:hypothetical protein [Lacihabitans soyangensis]|uniref:PorV/PorQ family protein n=1 Tax=Lacihabitans soyangensis TaxID=869394 RepID=A0AAE3H4I0_9BACT|nr:hypothetical protein [Lacihabitans soyangensis]MCP9764367.1 hypothetical protein [Lacihabitans soyangensis]